MCPRRLPRRIGIRVAELSAFGRARQDLFGTCCQVAGMAGMAIFGRLDMWLIYGMYGSRRGGEREGGELKGP